jgi:pimeloyl-ACP methyl ester carboxylesterase
MPNLIIAAIILTALLIVGYLVAVVVVAHRFTTPRRVCPSSPPTHVADAFRAITFPARGDVLPLTAWYCPVPSSSSAVVMVHGRDGCRSDVVRGETFAVAERLVASGCSVVLLDLRGHGGSSRARLTFGHAERRDVLGAVDFLLARGYAAGRIGVFGASMGGVSGIAAAVDEPAIGALVTDSAFADLEVVLRAQFRRLTHLPCACLRGALLAARGLTGFRLTDRPPHTLVRQLRGRPMLVIHAAGDPFVPVEHARLLAASAAARLWITPGTRHLASAAAVGARYADVVAEFFVSALFVDWIGSAPELPLDGAGGVVIADASLHARSTATGGVMSRLAFTPFPEIADVPLIP